MTLLDALRLGRVSNVPTVWTNAVAGVALAGATGVDTSILPLLLAVTLFYVGGMYLNDAFDAQIDRRERPERPIPAGRVARSTVFAAGFGMLGAGLVLLAWIGLASPGGTGVWPLIGGVALAAAIVLYDWYHKANPLSPLVMGVCRMLVYITAGLTVAVPLDNAVIVGAALLLCHLIGLTYIAKQENIGRVETMWPLAFLAAPILYGLYRGIADPTVLGLTLLMLLWAAFAVRFVVRRAPGDIPRAVVSLIAGICLLDAMLIATTGQVALAFWAILAFALTLALQRYVPGT